MDEVGDDASFLEDCGKSKRPFPNPFDSKTGQTVYKDILNKSHCMKVSVEVRRRR
jgi:hypothetical protein